MITQGWKLPHIAKGTLTWVPALNRLRLKKVSTGGTNSARYCYAVWLRHLVMLNYQGFKIKGTHIGELGPGDSIGTGLAALLSGAASYVGLDVFPFFVNANLNLILDELVELFARREPIPDNDEFPRIRPALKTYKFPDQAVEWESFDNRVERIRAELKNGLEDSQYVRYRAPWSSVEDIERSSLDLLFSQAVLEYADPLENAYQAMSLWIKPGGYASHRISFSATYLSPFWNGHWAYADWEWKLAHGRRECFLNRQPLSTHLDHADKFGFQISLLKREYSRDGLPLSDLSRRFRELNSEDLCTSGAYVIFRKGSNGI